MMASVRKRPWTHNGVTKEKWVVEYTDAGGARRRFTPKSGLKKDADRERLRIETEIEKGHHTAKSETVTVAQLATRFLSECDRRHRLGKLSGYGLKGYEGAIGRYIAPAFGAVKLTDITSQAVQQHIDSMIERGFSASTIGHMHGTLRSMLNFAIRKKLLKRNILVDEPCEKPARRRRMDIPSRDDMVRLLQSVSVRSPRETLHHYVSRQVMVALGIFAGLRPGETYGLQWEDIDFDNGVIHVRHNYSVVDGLKAPKSEAGIRDVPITPILRRALDAARLYEFVTHMALASGHASYSETMVSRRKLRLWDETWPDEVTGFDLSGFVLKTAQGKPFKATTASVIWRKMMEHAGLRVIGPDGKKHNRFTAHALRHAAVSLFIAEGLPAIQIKSIIGHSKVSTTLDIYGHLLPEDDRTKAAALAISTAFDAVIQLPKPPAPAISEFPTRQERDKAPQLLELTAGK